MDVFPDREEQAPPEPGTGAGTSAEADAAPGLVVLGSGDAPVCTDGTCGL